MPGELSYVSATAAIARAMVIEPKVLFADEPTGSLDSLNSEKVMELFIKTAKDNGTTVIMVTYEPTIAAYADREIIVRDGQIAGGRNEYQLVVVQKIWPPINWAPQSDGGGSRAWSFVLLALTAGTNGFDGSCAACRLAFCGI